SGVATLWLCRDKAWAISPGSAAEQASNAPFSDLNKSFQAFLKTFEIAFFDISIMLGTIKRQVLKSEKIEFFLSFCCRNKSTQLPFLSQN
ncbi:MAG: hypothetical protein IKB16_01130, partial [Lentisphaeria bacterium]|nr:hypothetical protein [Lentisphaeria bacterium]